MDDQGHAALAKAQPVICRREPSPSTRARRRQTWRFGGGEAKESAISGRTFKAPLLDVAMRVACDGIESVRRAIEHIIDEYVASSVTRSKARFAPDASCLSATNPSCTLPNRVAGTRSR